MDSVNINDHNGIKMTTGSAPNSTQPLILGNVNAANLLSSNLTSSQNNNVLIPTNVMTLPVSGASNQVIGILPIILHSSQIPGGLDSSQVIEINNDFNRSENNCTDGCVVSQPICHSNSGQVQSNLVSSDTLILSSESKLSSADTIPLISSSSDILKMKCPVGQLPIKQETTTPLQTTFSLVSALSNRSVDLESIPTINLFKPEVMDSKETVRNQVIVSTSTSNLISQSSTTMKNRDVPSKGYETRSKRKRKVTNHSQDYDVEMDMDTDTEAEDVCFPGAGSERKENSLTRDDTVILPDASTQNHSSLTASDTLIISSDSKFEPTLATSTGLPVEFPMSGSVGTHLNPILPVSGGNVISQPPLPSLSSIPSLMLTDSIVEGTVNPTLLCHFLSQSSENPARIQSIKSISLDQFTSVENLNMLASLQSMTQRPLIVSSQNSIQGVSLQNSSPVIPSAVTLNTSVKGTQTDWVLGNLPVSMIPSVPQTGEETSQQQVEETDVEQQHVDVEDTPVDQTAEELPFPCANCGQKFSSKNELQNHEKSAHKKTFKCDLCNSTFTRLGNYTRHRKIHNLKPDEKHYACPECGREFLQRCDLKRHLLIHSNQQPHRCELCDKGYIRHSDLVVHMRFHNKEKNFQCNMCDKKYFQSGDLNRHIRRTHKPTSLLTCGHCERKYAGEVTLIRHMKVIHKDIILNSVSKLDEL